MNQFLNSVYRTLQVPTLWITSLRMQEDSKRCIHHSHTWHTDNQTARIYRKCTSLSSWHSLLLLLQHRPVILEVTNNSFHLLAIIRTCCRFIYYFWETKLVLIKTRTNRWQQTLLFCHFIGCKYFSKRLESYIDGKEQKMVRGWYCDAFHISVCKWVVKFVQFVEKWTVHSLTDVVHFWLNLF